MIMEGFQGGGSSTAPEIEMIFFLKNVCAFINFCCVQVMHTCTLAPQHRPF